MKLERRALKANYVNLQLNVIGFVRAQSLPAASSYLLHSLCFAAKRTGSPYWGHLDAREKKQRHDSMSQTIRIGKGNVTGAERTSLQEREGKMVLAAICTYAP